MTLCAPNRSQRKTTRFLKPVYKAEKLRNFFREQKIVKFSSNLMRKFPKIPLKGENFKKVEGLPQC